MRENDYLFGSSKENLEDKKTAQNLAALDDIFNSSPISSDPVNNGIDNSSAGVSSNLNVSDSIFKNDPLEETRKFDSLNPTDAFEGLSLDQLNSLKGALKESQSETSNNEPTTLSNDVSNSSESYGGKQKVLTTNPSKKYSTDAYEILSSFISCSILSFITATMGAGWLIYILMHI